MDKTAGVENVEPSIPLEHVHEAENEADTEFLVSPRPVDVGLSINEIPLGQMTILERIRLFLQTCNCFWITNK
jgi:hypothetical protein